MQTIPEALLIDQPLIERASAAIQAAKSARTPEEHAEAYRELDTIADSAAGKWANTPQGALMQACLLAGEIDRLETEDAAAVDRLANLAMSLIAYIEEASGIRRQAFGFEFHTH